jgi:NitT/TauT family transport system permease protein
MSERVVRIAAPLVVGAAFLLLWEWVVAAEQIPPYILPPPSLIAASLWTDGPSLLGSLLVTLRVTLAALAAAALIGGAIALLFSVSRAVELSFFPYAVMLQVTPVVAIAPLVLIWVGLDHLDRALLILATIVAFFPILSNTTLGLKSVDHNLRDLFQLYGASRWQRLRFLQMPTALPYLLGGMKISGGLALIGAVVAEFVAGSGTGAGLAWRIIESANRLNIPRMFAALLLLSALGILIFCLMAGLQLLLLRHWHESAVRRER